MSGYCSYRGCSSKGTKGLSLFRFPKDCERAKIWVEASKRQDLLPKVMALHDSHRLCELHFENKYIVKGNFRKTLLPEAVPIQFSNILKRTRQEQLDEEIPEEPVKKVTILSDVTIGSPLIDRKIISNLSLAPQHPYLDVDDIEKMSKMKKLLEILSNPQQRMPLDTLKKCEIVLEKIDFKRGDSSVPTTSTAHLPFKEPHVYHSLLDAVNSNLQSPVINHTLHRTFGPTLEALFGPEIKLVPPLKKIKLEEPTSDIPDVLQGEIARLDQRFKVSLDPNQQPGSKSIQLTCWLDDKHLPCVPPISLIVPEDYPKMAPTCHMAPHEYNATQFLSAVQAALLARIKKLPKHFSVSQLLDTWEMSVRQASAPKHIPISAEALLMGL